MNFNTVLLNMYRHGDDAVGWHSDSEPELGMQPFIASLSLGASRDLILRRKDDNRRKITVSLAHGSLLKMSGELQRYWQHSLPRRRGVLSPRINLTFRYIHNKF
jgi:alkylated DNA repair dioxygenase AlkB